MAGTCIGVVSGKGGTGKTSFVSGVGAALSKRGKRVLCLDCDVGLRNLDLAMGLTDRALMDFTDVAEGNCTLDEAAVEHPLFPGLYLLTAPAQGRNRTVATEQMNALLENVRERFDYCLLDAPAGLGRGFTLATCGADRVVVITVSDPAALRDAQHTVMELDRFPEGTVHLVVNRVRSRLLRGAHTTIDDAMDQAGLPLLGLVPEDDALPLSLSRELPLEAAAPQSPAALAYRNIAGRILGEYIQIPLRLR